MYQRTIEVNLPKSRTINIKFKNITYNVSTGLRKEKKTILDGVSGFFKSGELTGIMGPSGAGKSSLLNLLTGFHKSNYEGDIDYVYNDTEQSFKNYQKLTCYIQQDDQLHSLFTTIESMRMAANLKIGSRLSKEAKEILINDILETLDLIKAKDTRCNLLSGGQRKRLSIALELIDNPPVMFLDEPTTGLDSSSTLQCISMLHSLTRGGRTIVCTIHQPSAGIYEMFDHIYLLADGHCMYQGAPTNTVDYFNRLGLQCPKYHNPADYMIEVVSKEYGNYNEQLTMATDSADSSERWRLGLHDKSTIHTTNDKTITQSEIDEQKAVILINPPSEFIRFWILLKRCILQLHRDWTMTHLKMLLHFVVGVLLGLLFTNAGSDGAKSISNVGFLMVTILYLCYTSMMPAVLRFPSELSVLKKEKFNNWYQLRTYYVASLCANLPVQAMFTIVYCSVSYCISSQPLDITRFAMFLITAILTTFVAESMGLIIGTILNPINGTFFGAIVMSVMVLFGGFLVLFRHMPTFMYYISYLSYLRYGIEGLIISVYGNNREKLGCSKEYCHYRMPSSILHEFSAVDEDFWLSITVLCINFIILRYICYCTLKKKLTQV